MCQPLVIPIRTSPQYSVTMSSTQDRFPQRLKLFRQRAGFSQAELARRVFLSRSYVAHFETGRKTPDLELLDRFAAVLGVSVAELVGEAEVAQLDATELLRQVARAADAGIERIQEVTSDRSQSPVRYYGRVPADAVRWVEARESGAVEQVWDQFLAGRSPSEFLTVTASGDCLGRRGILDDDTVLLEWANGRVPSNGRIVLVRLGDEFTLKIWWRDGDWVELRDGDGNVIARLSILAEFEVLGLYVNRWSPVGKSGE